MCWCLREALVGLEIGIGWLTLLMFGSLAVLLMAGLPLALFDGQCIG